jgi:hypothetical protein
MITHAKVERREKKFGAKERELKDAQEELQRQLVSFHRIFQENDAKKAQAEKSRETAKKVTKEKEKEIISLKEEIENLEEERAARSDEIQENILSLCHYDCFNFPITFHFHNIP